MEEKPSPASTSNSSGSVATPQSNARNIVSSQVIVTKQPPTHVFSDEWFEIEFDVDIVKGNKSLDSSEFVATLCHQKTKRPVADDDATLTLLPSSLVRFSPKDTPERRKRTLRCKIKPKAIRRDKPTAFFFQLYLKDSSSVVDILPASTHQVNVVNYKINISLNEDWEAVWYKDEGGRDKCMTVYVVLLNKDGSPYIGEQVPLELTLCYDSNYQPVKVSKQDILRVLGSLTPTTDKKTGKATLKFRIDDVSKNHQGQDFRLEVAPGPSGKGYHHVAPAYTPAVSVRSKRNKRQRTDASSKSEQTRQPSPIQLKPAALRPPSERIVSRGIDASFTGVDTHRLQEAMKGVMQWSEEVVNGLYSLQWQMVGYAQNPDGSPDFSMPYHSMQNPNEYIHRVLSMYSETTREHLNVLWNAVERSSLPGDTAGMPSLRLLDDSMIAGQGLHHPGGPFTPIGSRGGSWGAPMHAPLPRGSFLPMPGSQPLVIPPDVFRGKGEMSGYPSQAAHGASQAPMQIHGPMGARTLPGAAMRMSEVGTMPGHPTPTPLPQTGRMGKSGPVERGQQRSDPTFEDENRESEVAYVLAKQFKAMSTGERLGFPAYSESKELLGFYRESSMKVGVGQFLPIDHRREHFGPREIMHASQILDEAFETKSDAVYALKDWGTISNLIDHALVYDWSKDIGAGTNNSTSSSGES
jgi:hypothetical protein